MKRDEKDAVSNRFKVSQCFVVKLHLPLKKKNPKNYCIFFVKNELNQVSFSVFGTEINIKIENTVCQVKHIWNRNKY